MLSCKKQTCERKSNFSESFVTWCNQIKMKFLFFGSTSCFRCNSFLKDIFVTVRAWFLSPTVVCNHFTPKSWWYNKIIWDYARENIWIESKVHLIFWWNLFHQQDWYKKSNGLGKKTSQPSLSMNLISILRFINATGF